MATYFQNLGNQNLLNPYQGDPEPPGNMMMYLNQASYAAGSYSEVLSGGNLPPQKYPDSEGVRNEMMFIPPTSDQVRDCDIGGDSLIGKHGIQDHGLSLSLSTQIPQTVSLPSFQYQYPNSSLSSVLSNAPVLGKGDEYNQSEEFRNFESLASGLYGGGHEAVKTQAFYNPLCSSGSKEMCSEAYLDESLGSANTMLSSKYLKAAQQLLDEVVNVRKALKQSRLNKNQSFKRSGIDGTKETDGSDQHLRRSTDPSKSSAVSSIELSPSERQDLQNKKTKLLSMLNEVDQRYKQYYHQMQAVVSYFDKVAGNGAAGPYTALALQAISRHFRSLRDAIKGQIQVTRKSLGEQDNSSDGQGSVIPRLRYVDQQLRQQRAFQQLGGLQHAWRPQRGLPESSVTILRAWLFEHFLLPYLPEGFRKDYACKADWINQKPGKMTSRFLPMGSLFIFYVANWFINARVRLWKPMIEDIYKEEFGDLDMDSKSSPENALKEEARVDFSASEDRKEELHESLISATADSIEPGKLHDSKSGHNSTYDMPRLDHFTVGSDVSLALELRHCEEHDGFPPSTGSHVTVSDAAASLDCHYEDPEQQHLIQVWQYPRVT
ncbi:BEL1-like homeodomain protein 3 [Pyrus ussuriensis x Pyrus communis]|uniref:BEL1-like homeodomain protein 3 n=1 Tax=Pyrus ussuriensis x Pyrus communis TaxID=2448454 RepID=A0A5N5FN46_9ROSA|nr:BEL1-like homeodomain protein 3 [Pyrus ussuriensis x Pyrus communis]